MSTKKPQSDKFLNIPRDWVYLIGYKYPVINRCREPKLNKNKEQITKRIDYVDLLLMDEIRGFKERGNKECFKEANALAESVGMYGNEKIICDKVLQLCNLGFIRAYRKIDDKQRTTRIVLETNTDVVNSVATAMKKQIETEKRMHSQHGDFLSLLRKNNMLQEYLQEYLQENLQEPLPEQLQEQLQEQLPEHKQEPLHEDSQEPLPEHLQEKLPEPLQVDSQGHLQEELHVEGIKTNIVSVRDIFENAVNPLREQGWTWEEIDGVVKDVTGKKQQIKEIAKQEERIAVYEKFMEYLNSGEKRKQGNQIEEVGCTTNDVWEVANCLHDWYDWTWDEISGFMASLTGKRRIQDLKKQEEITEVYENLLYNIERYQGKVD